MTAPTPPTDGRRTADATVPRAAESALTRTVPTLVRDYGDPASEYAALRTGALLVDRSHRDRWTLARREGARDADGARHERHRRRSRRVRGTTPRR